MERELPRCREIRLKQYDYSRPGYYFVTICTAVRRQNILCTVSPAVGGGLCPAPPSVCLTGIGETVDAAIQAIPRTHPGVKVDTYCIMPDHIHMIVGLEAGRDRARPLHEIIGRMKSYTDWQYRKMGAAFGPRLWQKSFYDHVIRNDTDLAETRQYIVNNPLNWTLNKD